MMSLLWFVWRTNAGRTLYMQRDREGFMSTAQAVESTDKHVLYDKQALSHIDKQNNPRWLMTDVSTVYSEKNAALPPSWEGKKTPWPIWIAGCVDCWCLCHLLLSLWADSVCGVQSEPEVSSQSHSCSVVDWNSAALPTLCLLHWLPTHVPRCHWP